MQTLLVLTVMVSSSFGLSLDSSGQSGLGVKSEDEREYFPVGSFAEDHEAEERVRSLLQGYLEKAGESSLYKNCSGKDAEASLRDQEIYRLILLRNFDPAIIVRVSRLDDTSMAKVARFPGSRLSSGEPELRRMNIVPKCWVNLSKEVSGSDFWGDLESWVLPEGHILVDGSQWIVEGCREGRYRIVYRWLPLKYEIEDGFVDLGTTILKVGSVELGDRLY